ncbi:FAD-dependent oxidoreductase [Pseudomonas oryzihabitans]|uniref:apoptosis inducing factor family protein n=1 Tax=Pseudomonas oryzihabitans TaxID=47885 RepID=UPI00165E3C91|nr:MULTISPECIES: apoptosis inducing factor family protein [Pseudomonas]MDK8264602.1 FAD-dependent oxidoreductase [Pseudomonas oryzihabitans]QNQ98218.1 pyridine nucleotide-disulfide oxidoreductase [Pseudomonas psychrotolerans]
MKTMHPVAHLADLREDRGTAVEIEGTAILLLRVGDEVRAFQAQCPHAGAPLAEGAVCQGRLVCPWHKASFAVDDGRLCEPPALDALQRYPVDVRDGEVLVGTEPLPAQTAEPQSDDRLFIVIGAGAAGTAVAAALREFGFGGRLLLIGREPGEPYDRTALSKFVLQGDKAPDEAPPLREADFFRQQRIERLHVEVTRLDPQVRQLELANGQTLNYDGCVLATGGEPRPLDVPGAELKGVHLLRTRADAAAILANLPEEGRVVIVGASFIGLEAASALRKQGLAVDVVAPASLPFVKQMGETLGQHFKTLHEANGVTFHAPSEVVGFAGDDQVRQVSLKDGTHLPADLVLVGTGIAPATAFLANLPLAEDGSVPVDTQLQAAAGLYAVGDLATFPFAGQPTRIEHWRLAQQHGRLAARNLLGHAERYADVPFFWTLHHGKRYEYLGHPRQWDDMHLDGSLGDQTFVALLLAEDRVVGVVACQRERATAVLSQLMRQPLSRARALDVLATS